MRDMWDDIDDGDPSPICSACGVSALAPDVADAPSICENADCDLFGEPIPD